MSGSGSVVLVHGAWGNPDDWWLVREPLARAGVTVVAPDLPSHRSETATRADDIAEVERAISHVARPVIAVGWSYGTFVLSDLDVEKTPVDQLVFVSAVPQPLASLDGDEPPEQTPDMSHWQVPSEHTVVLDEEWWLAEEGDRFPPEVMARLKVNHRRPITLAAALAAPTGEAWRKVPTTILLGEIDGRVSRPLRQWAQRHFNDVRLIDWTTSFSGTDPTPSCRPCSNSSRQPTHHRSTTHELTI